MQTPSPAQPTQHQHQQQYRFLAVLDYEATCESDNKKLPGPQEIIEVPVVVLDASRPGAPVHAEFHRYVRPVCVPQLTAFCTSLTGIRQETVNAAEDYCTVFAQLT
ncbi:3'-5' exoribonuclease 1, partial [Cladochytrium tenue]